MSANFQTIEKFSSETGYTKNAIYKKKDRGIWVEGEVWFRAPDGHILISIKGYDKWVVSGMKESPKHLKPASKLTLGMMGMMYDGVRCKERLKLKPTASNLKKAHLHRCAILDAIVNNTFDYAITFPDSKKALELTKTPGNAILVKTHLDLWLKTKRKQISSSTYDGYRKIVNNILIPTFGEIRLTDLKRLDIKNWARAQTCSNKRISNILSPFRTALEEAVEDEIIENNILNNWHYKNKEAPKIEDDIDPFSIKEMALILNNLSGQGKNLFQFAFWTGLRTSEFIALNWSDIDFNNEVVIVRKALTQHAKEAEDTKTKSGRREVKLLPPAISALKKQKEHTYLKGEEVFQNPRTLERWEGDQPVRKTLWVHALKKAEVRYRRPYQTRHTYASMMLSAGESPVWIKTQMGHSNLGLIFKTYGKWIPNESANSGSLVMEAFGKDFNKQVPNGLFLVHNS